MKNVISRVKGSQPAPILLVANKLDLDCQREVSTAEGNLNYQRSNKLLAYLLSCNWSLKVMLWLSYGNVRSSKPRQRIGLT